MLAACGRTVKLAATPTAQFRCADGDPGAGVISASSTGGPVVSQDIVVALAVSHWVEHQTDWSIKKFERTARPYRTRSR
jgi:hypothetical protein